MRPADGRLQIGRTFRRGQLCFSQIVYDLFRLPEQQHSPCLQRNELFRRILELGRLAQLHVRGSRIAFVEQRLAEQETCLGQIGFFLQRVLQLDNRSLAVVLGQIVFC